jgi:hypothetical protein
MSNRIDDARAAVAEALKLNPKYSVKLMSERFHKPPAVAEALRKGGRRKSERGACTRQVDDHPLRIHIEKWLSTS